MISIILPYYNSLKQRPIRTKQYFEMVNSYLGINNDLQFIISDYGSTDNIRDYIRKYPRFEYVYTKPNEGEFFNISKCYNNAIKIVRNQIIFTNGIDGRYNYIFLQYVIDMFRVLGEITLEAPVFILKEDDSVEKFIYVAIFLKRFIVEVGGWDERIFNWGQEDHDIIESLYHHKRVPVHRFTHSLYNMVHLWHDNVFYKKGGEERNKKNIAIMKENIANDREDIVNSYWKSNNGLMEIYE